MAQTTTPTIFRYTLQAGPNIVIRGEVPGAGAGVIVYVYLNLRRAGTAITLPDGRWNTGLTFGGGAQVVKPRDRVYATARAVGEDTSERTVIYTIEGIEQPGAPYVFDEVTTKTRFPYERDRLIQGDVPPPVVFFDDNPTKQVLQPFVSDTSVGLKEGATISVYLDRTFLASAQTNKIGHWELNLLGLDHPLLPLQKGQRLTVKATRHFVDGQGNSVRVLQPSAESDAAVVQSAYFEQRLFKFFPEQWRIDDDTTGDLSNYTRILALTMDEVKSWIDTFPVIFDIDNCESKHFPAIAKLLGYPLNRLDSEESQRLQVKHAIQFWRKKGTTDVFRLIFYLLDFDIDVIELWTEDYETFHPLSGVVFRPALAGGFPLPQPDYSDTTLYPLGIPNDAPELIENDGTWFKSPYFGIVIRPQQAFFNSCDENGTPLNQGVGGPFYDIDCENCPDETTSASVGLSIDDLRYLLERIDQFRPAHTVLDFLRFAFEIRECGPIPDDALNWHVHWFPTEKGWFDGYCEEDDPTYFRRAIAVRDSNGNIVTPGSTRPDQLGTVDLGVRRADAATPVLGLNAPTQPHINMNRNPQPGICNPIEEFFWTLIPVTDEQYNFFMRRDGLGEGFYPLQEPVTNKDHSDWPSRNPASGTVTATAWTGTTAYVIDDEVSPTAADPGFYFIATVAGTSGGTEPVWPDKIGTTIVDGTVTWIAVSKFPPRSGLFRYAERLTIRLETYTGP